MPDPVATPRPPGAAPAPRVVERGAVERGVVEAGRPVDGAPRAAAGPGIGTYRGASMRPRSVLG